MSLDLMTTIEDRTCINIPTYSDSHLRLYTRVHVLRYMPTQLYSLMLIGIIKYTAKVSLSGEETLKHVAEKITHE